MGKEDIMDHVIKAVIDTTARDHDRIEAIREQEPSNVQLRQEVANGTLSFIERRDDHVLVSIETIYPDKHPDPMGPDDDMIAFVEALKKTQFDGGYGKDISWGMFGFLLALDRNLPSRKPNFQKAIVQATKLGLITFCICENGIGRDFIEIHFKA